MNITKKESESQYLADLKKIRKAYVQDVKENHSNTIISENSEKNNPSSKKSSEKNTKGMNPGRRSSLKLRHNVTYDEVMSMLGKLEARA